MPFTKEYWEQKRQAKLTTGAIISNNPNGRQVGQKNALTILKEKKRAEFETSIAKMAKKLTNAQSIVALGTHKMVQPVIGENGKIEYRVIKDEKEMQIMLDTKEHGKDYIIIVGNEPDWKASNALLDRAFGKAKETIDLTAFNFSLKDLAMVRKDIKDKPLEIENEIVVDEQKE